jgi:hypothetical protein
MIGVLLAFYPAQWRRRYGEEFRAVLESRPLGPFDVADVLLGAIDARTRALRIAGLPENDGGHLTMLRIGGFGAIAGGVLWAGGFIFGSAEPGDKTVWFGVLAAGSLGILVALVGLSAFQARQGPGIVWAAFLIPAIGCVLSVVGIVGSLSQDSDLPMVLGVSPWNIWMLGLVGTAIGSILFGIATVQAEVLSRRAATSLAVSALTLLTLGLLGMGSQPWPSFYPALIAVTIVAFGGSWVWLGIAALRRGPIRAVAPA